MKQRSDHMPPVPFSIERQPKRQGYVRARFYDNLEPFHETIDGAEITGYMYDEYYLELLYYDGLEADIAANLSPYFNDAKQREVDHNIPLVQQSSIDHLLVVALEGK